MAKPVDEYIHRSVALGATLDIVGVEHRNRKTFVKVFHLEHTLLRIRQPTLGYLAVFWVEVYPYKIPSILLSHHPSRSCPKEGV